MEESLKFLKKINSIFKILAYYLLNRKISNQDYKEEYNVTTKNYKFWTDRMGKYTDNIIKLEYLIDNKNDEIKILDFCCGTGYITKKLLEIFDSYNIKNKNINITAVDISDSMIDYYKAHIKDDRVNSVVMDGIEFLKSTPPKKYNAIFCGWALPYFNYNTFLSLLNNILEGDGLLGIISNSKGTLMDIEKIYTQTMIENSSEINKIMDISFNLPNGENGLIKWFKKYKFTPIKTGEGEEIVSFNSPSELYKWIQKTGAIAGTGKIFKDNSKIEKKIIEKIKEKRYVNGKYTINHKFVYGLFQRHSVF